MTPRRSITIELMTLAQLRGIDWNGTIAVTVHNPWDTTCPISAEPIGQVLPLTFDCLADSFRFSDKDGRVLACWLKCHLDGDNPPSRIIVSDSIASGRAQALGLAIDATLNGPAHATRSFLLADGMFPDERVFSAALRHLDRRFGGQSANNTRFDWASELASNRERWYRANLKNTQR